MSSPSLLRKKVLALVALALFPLVAFADGPGHGHSVYTMSNAADGNRVLAYSRRPHGALELVRSYPTGGLGTDTGLGNQGGLVMSENGRWLLAVNAGSDEISVFAVWRNVLVLSDVVPSGGKQPVSLALDHNLVYVLNAGGAAGDSDNITGFVLTPTGRLLAIPDSTQPLSAANTGPAQIGFSSSGNVLIVTEKATNLVGTYVVNDDGVAGAPQFTPSAGATPFGFAAGPRNRLFVSEAFGGAPDASTVSSYQVFDDGHLEVIAPTVATTESAACWLVLARGGRYAYTTNTASNTISGFRVSRDGALQLLDANGATATTGAGPIDAAVSRDSGFLYVLNSGAHTIDGFRIRADGSLQPIGTASDLPTAANGLVAR